MKYIIFLLTIGFVSCDTPFFCGTHCDEGMSISVFIQNDSNDSLVIVLEEWFPLIKNDLYDTLVVAQGERLFATSLFTPHGGGDGDAVLGKKRPHEDYKKAQLIYGEDTLYFTNGVTDGVYDSTVCQDPLNPLCKENYQVIVDTETKREELFIFNP